MKKKLAIFALIVIAAGFALAVTPAIQTATQNLKPFEAYSIKGLSTKTTTPFQTPTQGSETLESSIQLPDRESCATGQSRTLGDWHNIELCRRFDDDYNIITGSVTVELYGHEYKWKLEDQGIFDDEVTIACYVNGAFKSRETDTEGGVFYCDGAGHSLYFDYDEFIKGNRAECHSPCNDHDDEVDNSKIQGDVYMSGRLPGADAAVEKPIPQPDAFKAFINKIRAFMPWIG